jgi:hypothetical protein
MPRWHPYFVSKKSGTKVALFFGVFGCFPKHTPFWWWIRESPKSVKCFVQRESELPVSTCQTPVQCGGGEGAAVADSPVRIGGMWKMLQMLRTGSGIFIRFIIPVVVVVVVDEHFQPQPPQGDLRWWLAVMGWQDCHAVVHFPLDLWRQRRRRQ